MKKITQTIVLGVLMFLPMMLMAQSFSVNRSDYHQSAYDFHSPQASVSMQNVGGNAYTVIDIQGTAPSTTIGLPNLPVITELVEVPLCQNVKVAVSDVVTKDFETLKYPVMPVQPAPSKADRGLRPIEINSQFYAANQLSEPTAWVEMMGVARDRNVAMLRVCPFAYNPVTGQLQQVVSMKVVLTYEDADVAATEQMHARYYSPDFSLGMKTINTLPCTKAVRHAAPLHYLIVSHSSFRGQLDDFIAWKKRQGFIVTVGYTDEANVGSSSTSIAAYIKGFYTNATAELPAPTYLLLVGDDAQIPTFNSRCTSPASDHITDLYYVTWTDGDNVPDCYQGRFSARNVNELTPQIEKTLLYEGYNFEDDSYLARGILIAGEDGGYTGDNAYRYSDPAMDYIAKTYVNASNGYTSVTYYKNNVNFAPASVTVDGSCSANSTSNALRNLYNQGAGWVNYSAHGYDDSWSTPSFNCNNVSAMTNNGRPGIMIGNCCLSGKFNTRAYDQCLGEALLRKRNNAGAVAYIGGTNSTYWPQDFCWAVGVRNSISNTMNTDYDPSHLGVYDRLFHTHAEPFSAWHHTAGSINVAGNMAVAEYGSYALYYWEIYELFGDPSLMPWLGTASQMQVSCSPILPLGTPVYDVTAVPYAYVALTTDDNHDLIAAAYADASGVAHLNIPDNITPGAYELSVWAQNYRPYFQQINVTVLDGAFVNIVDIKAENSVRPGRVSNLTITLVNLGNSDAANTEITLSSNNAVLNNSIIHSGLCPAGDTVVLTNACPLYVPTNLANGDIINISAVANFGGSVNPSKNVNLTVSASQLVASNWNISPVLTPGSPSTISIDVANQGSHPSGDVTFMLECPYGFLSTAATPIHQGVMASGEQTVLSFNIALAADAPNTSIPFVLLAQTSDNEQQLAQFSFRCGNNSVEDFESGTLTAINWSNGSNPWEITTSEKHAGSYSARSKTNLGDRNSSELTLVWSSAVDDSISFFYKVSSETNYDIFRFYIDGNEQLDGSGVVDWTRVSYFVPAGTHTFLFEYSKDGSMSRNSDCAWIDDITLPYTGVACQFQTDTICQGADYTFAGQAVATDEVGTFAFVNNNNNTRVYLALTVLPAPEVTIDITRLNGSCFLLKAHGATSYLWDNQETSDAIIVCPSQATTYNVTGFRGGCSTDAFAEISTQLGIDDVEASSILLYPNPAHDRVVVAAQGIRSIQVVNLMGQVVESRQAQSDVVTIDLQHYATGVYFVRIETANSVAVKKLVRK